MRNCTFAFCLAATTVLSSARAADDSAPVSGEHTRYLALSAAAQQDWTKPGTREIAGELTQVFFAQADHRCVQPPRSESVKHLRFDLIATIEPNGKISETVIDPVTMETACFRDVMRRQRLKARPAAPVHIRIRMRPEGDVSEADQRIFNPAGTANTFRLADSGRRCATLQPPRLDHRVDVRLSRALELSNAPQQSELLFRIDAHGRVALQSVVSSSSDDWTAAVRKALEQWAFQPALCDGEPVDVVFTLSSQSAGGTIRLSGKWDKD